MKVAVNTRLLLSHRMEGIARFIYETTKRMVLTNPNIEFHFFFDRPFDKKFIFASNVFPHVLNPPSRHPILWYLWFEYAVPRKLSKLNIDVFLSGDMFLSLKTKVPTVMVSHDLNYIHYPKGLKWSHLKFMQHYFPKYHKLATHIIAVSEYTKKDIVKQLNINPQKISVAYNSAPNGFRAFSKVEKLNARQKFTEGQAFFMYVGSLHPRKNVERLILAFDQFKHENKSNYKLVLFGRLAFKTNAIFQTYEKLRCKKDILFLGDEDCNINELLPAAEALCYVSLFEGFGIPILEAFGSEVPVITSNTSSMPEVAGDAAHLVDPLSVDQICNAMQSISENAKLNMELIERGKKQLLKFDWNTSSEIIMKAIKNLKPKKN